MLSQLRLETVRRATGRLLLAERVRENRMSARRIEIERNPGKAETPPVMSDPCNQALTRTDKTPPCNASITYSSFTILTHYGIS